MSAAAEASGERGIAAARSIRQALSGDGSVAMYAETSLALPPEAFVLPESAPEALVNLPDRTALFVGRERELGLLDQAFTAAGGVVVQAVHGLGGIGKSTLAARWAAGRVGSYNPVWWITAETPADLDAGLAELAVALQPALRDVLSREALRERAVQWLAGREGWLLVLDNVSDPADVKALLGRATGGRFLITTRRATGWHKVASPLSLDVLEPAEAAELFERIDGPGEDVEALCGELGYLPLAVEQAAAYCAEAGISAGRYRELLAAYPEEVFAQSAEGTDRTRTVARVWRVSLDRLADTPLAGRILGIIAWWAPEGIPRAYLESMGSAVEVTEALRRLAAHSMVKLHEDGTISVHRLVQAVARVEGGTFREAAYTLLGHDTMGGIVGEAVWLSHLEAMAGHTAPETEAEPQAWLFNMGGLKYSIANTSRAVELHSRAVAAADRTFGPDHRNALQMRTHLAQAHGYAGDHTRAVELLERALADHERVLDPSDEQTFTVRSILADALEDARRSGDAISLARSNAEDAERVLGDDHLATLKAWAVWVKVMCRDTASDVAETAQAVEDLLARAARSVGEDSHVFDDLHRELVELRWAAGDIEGAEALLEESILRRTRIYGATSRITLGTRRYLVVFVWGVREDPVRAGTLAAALVADCEELLGDDLFVEDLRQDFTRLFTPPPGVAPYTSASGEHSIVPAPGKRDR